MAWLPRLGRGAWPTTAPTVAATTPPVSPAPARAVYTTWHVAGGCDAARQGGGGTQRGGGRSGEGDGWGSPDPAGGDGVQALRGTGGHGAHRRGQAGTRHHGWGWGKAYAPEGDLFGGFSVEDPPTRPPPGGGGHVPGILDQLDCETICREEGSPGMKRAMSGQKPTRISTH